MPGKRTNDRAHHGPEEDRARKPSNDRARGKLKSRGEPDRDTEGLTVKDAERMRKFQQS